jgi:hypothetical protein
MNRDPRGLAVADRVYAFALHLYPRDFREAWGSQMRQGMRDRWRACAKEDRSAFGIAFALFPDLLASAGREHLHAFGEEAAIKRILLGSALMVSVGLFAMQGRISTQIAAWQEARTWTAVDTAYRKELQRTALASPEPAIRALLWTLDDPNAQPPAAHAAGESPLNPAVGRDRLADFLAAASCRDDAMLARLEAADPGNGAVWAVAATCAQRAKRPGTARQALVRLAQSDHYDSRSGDLLGAGTDLLKRVPEPFVFMPGDSPTALDYLKDILWYAHEPEFQAFGGLCRQQQALEGDASMLADCRAAAEALSRADSDWVRQFGTAWIARVEGHPLGEAAHRELNDAQQQALAKWWALDAATRTARIAGGGNEIGLLHD